MKINGIALRRGLIVIVLMIVAAFLGFGQFATFMMRTAESNSYVAERYLGENYPGFSQTGGSFRPVAWRKSSHIFLGSMDGNEVEIEIVVDRGRAKLEEIRRK
jgi:hypothetical protein